MARLFGFGGVPKARRGDYSPYGGNTDWHAAGGVSVSYTIDASELMKLQMALREAGAHMPTIMMRSFNRGLDKLFTQTKYMLKEVTGVRKMCRVTRGPGCKGRSMIKRPARKGSHSVQVAQDYHASRTVRPSPQPPWLAEKLPARAPGSMTTVSLIVRDRHSRITAAYYGAKWAGVTTPGATHHAWNRPQTARGAFMIAGRKPVFKRTSSARFPIAPLWGPNMAREMERNAGKMRKIQHNVWHQAIRPEAMRLLELHLRRQKGKHGL